MRGNDGTRTGGEILIDQLAIHGVRHVFCVPGESYLAALDAFHDSDIALTVCRHESAAAIMAETVGKTTGRPGVCFVTRGPGATNASAGIHIARQDSSPMIMFVGQVGRHMREREAFQEIDYRAVFGTIAKWATEIDDPARIPELVSRAFHTACNGRPGPVVIAVPEDMLIERASGAGCDRLCSGGDLAGHDRHEPAANTVGSGRAPDRGGRRQPLVAASLRGADALCRTFCGSGCHQFPPLAFVRRVASLLRRRSRHRAQSEIAGTRQGRRPGRPARRPHERDAVAELHAVRNP